MPGVGLRHFGRSQGANTQKHLHLHSPLPPLLPLLERTGDYVGRCEQTAALDTHNWWAHGRSKEALSLSKLYEVDILNLLYKVVMTQRSLAVPTSRDEKAERDYLRRFT